MCLSTELVSVCTTAVQVSFAAFLFLFFVLSFLDVFSLALIFLHVKMAVLFPAPSLLNFTKTESCYLLWFRCSSVLIKSKLDLHFQRARMMAVTVFGDGRRNWSQSCWMLKLRMLHCEAEYLNTP